MKRNSEQAKTEAIAMYIAGDSVKAILEQTGIDGKSLHSILKTRGIERNRRKQLILKSPGLAEKVAELATLRKSWQEIAEETGLTAASLAQWSGRQGFKKPSHYRSDPDETKQRAIQMRLAGESLSSIGKALGVTKQRVHQILKNGETTSSS